jgi:DNA topoisomerase-3
VIEFDINGETFTAKGLMVEQLNYLEVYPYDRWTDKALPVFQEGEEIMPSGSFLPPVSRC